MTEILEDEIRLRGLWALQKAWAEELMNGDRPDAIDEFERRCNTIEGEISALEVKLCGPRPEALIRADHESREALRKTEGLPYALAKEARDAAMKPYRKARAAYLGRLAQ